ncbi:MAG: SBBP repeat-containing protein [Bacteroidia bacterium]|nr:SBBP repeat-containing protein [Bacteroidia bacterium]
MKSKYSYVVNIYYRSLVSAAFIFTPFISISQPAFNSGGNSVAFATNVKAEHWMETPFGFKENRGQMMGSDHKPASYVLFEAQAPNLNIWVTTSGLTYQFFTIQKNNTDNGGKVRSVPPEIDKTMQWNRIDMVLKGASIKKENVFTEGDISEGEENYYTDRNPDGIFNIKTYAKIVVKEIYQGIDWVLYTSESSIKYDFIVRPNANLNQIKLIYEGSGDFHVENNRIRFSNELGELTEGELICYQGNESNIVQSHYEVKENVLPLYAGVGKLSGDTTISPSSFNKSLRTIFSYEVSINIHDYDKKQTLVIDPQLVWATFFGGSSGISFINSMDDDLAGNIFATGYLGDNPFPVFNPGGGAYFQVVPFSGTTAFVLKFSNSGVRLWATYYTGNINEVGLGICTDPFGNIFVTGWTSSTVFPLFNPGGGAYYQATRGGVFGAWDISDAFILKFSNTGVRLWATYYGGGLGDAGKSICSDNLGNIFVTGYTRSNADFPRQNPGSGAYFQSLHGGSVSVAQDAGDVFILKFNNSGVRQWSTFYGGTDDDVGNGICSDLSGNIIVVGASKSTDFPLKNFGMPSYYQSALSNPFSFNPPGSDAFILKFNNSGLLQSSTYYGGNSSDEGHSVATDSFGNIFVTGNTLSTDFPVLNPGGGAYYQPVKNGTYDAFILKFTNTGVRLWATLIGGSGSFEALYGSDNINIDPCNNVYMGFDTPAADLLTLSSCGSDYLDNSYNNTTVNAGWTDVYIIKFKNSGVPLWATYFGGDGEDWGAAMTTDQSGNFFVGGNWGNVTNDATYPLTNPGGGAYYSGFVGSDDCYISKFIPSPVTLSTTSLNNTSGCSCNGSASVTVSCSANNFNYSWSNGSQTLGSTNNTNTISNLCPGVYTVSVNDGCTPVVT